MKDFTCTHIVFTSDTATEISRNKYYLHIYILVNKVYGFLSILLMQQRLLISVRPSPGVYCSFYYLNLYSVQLPFCEHHENPPKFLLAVLNAVFYVSVVGRRTG